MQATRRKLTEENQSTFAVHCIKTMRDPHAPLEYFTKDTTYNLLGVERRPQGLLLVSLNNYQTPHTLGFQTDDVFKTHFKLVNL